MKKIILITILTFCISLAFAQTKEQINHLDSYYEKALKEWNIPGMAIAIVKNDSIIFSKGYGYANIEEKTKVDFNTLFAIASNSKAFTATAIAQLVEQKKIKWTDKVIDYLPYFKMYDEYTTHHTTIEDLLCHRSGLKTFSGDLLWYGTTKTAEEILSAQQHLTPTSEFRTKFGYSNLAYLAAGKVIEKVTDTTWSNYVSAHFLKPLKMNRTLTSTSQLKNTTNSATPYFIENEKAIELNWLNWDNIAPAGALISSVNDYAKWLSLNINKGTLNGETYYSKNSYTTLTTPHINFRVGKNTENVHFKSYALGWNTQDYQGYQIIGHGGGYDGMISKSTFVPEKRLGIIILTNSLNWVPGALVNKSLDVLLANKLEAKDWSENYLGYYKKNDSTNITAQLKNEKLRYKLQKKHKALKEYTGAYTDKMYGTVTITEKDNTLYFSMDNTPIFKANLKHWNHHIFTFRFDTNLTSLPEGKLWFDLDKNGKVAKLHIDIPNPDFYFDEFDFIKNK